jgi:ribonucleoside-diphosphate reductase alpha chain
MQTPVQRHMPRRRSGHTTAVTIDGERFYLTANGREDNSLGEVFMQWRKQGSSQAGLMDTYAIALSVGLQHGVPLADLLRPGLGLYFVPYGYTDDPEIPRVRSVVDYFSRRLAIDWLPYPERVALGVFTITERVLQTSSEWIGLREPFPSPVQAYPVSSLVPGGDDDARLRWELATTVASAR